MSIFDNLEKFGDSVALEDDSGANVSFNCLISESDALVSNLVPNSLLLLLGSNDIPIIHCYVGALRRRVTPILLSDKSSLETVRRTLEVFRIRYLFCEEPSSNFFPSYSRVSSFQNFVLLESMVHQVTQINPNLALMLPTSGSTGSHKMVRISDKNLKSNTLAIIESLSIGQEDKAITSLPSFYTFGLSVINSHLMAGACIRLTKYSVLQREFWDAIRVAQITSFSGVPYMFRILSRLNLKSLLKNTNLRYVSQAGGKLAPEEVLNWHEMCREFGIEFIVMYGQTEATARMSVLRGDDVRRLPNSAGRAIVGGQFKIEFSGAKSLTYEEGEVIYLGPNVCMGYAESSSDLILGDENHGVLRTGDFGKIDEDDFLFILGRNSNLFKIRGVRIDLSELDGKVAHVCDDFAVYGKSEELHFFVLNDEHVEPIRRILSELTEIRLSDCQFHVVPLVPRTETGKVQYSILEQLLADKGI